MKKILSIAFIAFFCIASQSAFAESFTSLKSSSWTEQKSYADKTVHKLGFGLLNIATGWGAVFFELDKAKSTNIFTGLAKGIWLTVTNEVGGVLHTATFPIPLDIPLPAGGIHFE